MGGDLDLLTKASLLSEKFNDKVIYDMLTD